MKKKLGDEEEMSLKGVILGRVSEYQPSPKFFISYGIASGLRLVNFNFDLFFSIFHIIFYKYFIAYHLNINTLKYF
ncbi:hypothetical protein JXI42_13525 [bacterium]|nr:hypothetical protein [bacterium]